MIQIANVARPRGTQSLLQGEPAVFLHTAGRVWGAACGRTSFSLSPLFGANASPEVRRMTAGQPCVCRAWANAPAGEWSGHVSTRLSLCVPGACSFAVRSNGRVPSELAWRLKGRPRKFTGKLLGAKRCRLPVTRCMFTTSCLMEHLCYYVAGSLRCCSPRRGAPNA